MPPGYDITRAKLAYLQIFVAGLGCADPGASVPPVDPGRACEHVQALLEEHGDQELGRPEYDEARELLARAQVGRACDTRALVLSAELELSAWGSPALAQGVVAPERAAEALGLARSCGTDDLDLGMRIANAYKRLGRPDEAVAWFRRQVRGGEDLSFWSYQLLNELYLARRYDEVVAEGERLRPRLVGSPALERGRFLDFLGRTYLELGQQDLAQAALLESITLVERSRAADQRAFISCPYLSLGGLYRDQGRPVEGLLLLIKAAEAEPGKADSQEAAARFAHELGRDRLALGYAERAVSLEPTAPREALLRDLQAALADVPGQEDPALGEVLDNERALGAAVHAFEDQDFAEAELLVVSAGRLPTDPRWRVLVALLQVLSRQPDGAADSLAALRRSHPQLPSVHVALAHLAVVQQDYASAQVHLDRAQALLEGPADPLTLAWFPAWGAMVQHLQWLAQGWSASNQGKHVQAFEFFEQLLGQRPEHPFALLGAGNALLALGRASEAEQRFRRVLDRDPGSQQATAQLALALLEQGNLEEAGRNFQKALRLGPDSYTCPHEGLGLVYLRRGMEEQAERHFVKAIELNPDIEYAKYNGLARIYMDRGRFDESEALLHRSQQNVPWEPTASHLLEELAQRRAAAAPERPTPELDSQVAESGAPAVASPLD